MIAISGKNGGAGDGTAVTRHALGPLLPCPTWPLDTRPNTAYQLFVRHSAEPPQYLTGFVAALLAAQPSPPPTDSFWDFLQRQAETGH